MTTPPGPPYTETTDIGECIVLGCSEVADTLTRQTACGCSLSILNCMRGHRVMISVIQPACREGAR